MYSLTSRVRLFLLCAVIVTVTAVVFYARPAGAKSPPPGAGVADIPANILLALDVSGSMSSVVATGSTFSYPYDVAVDSRGYTYIAEAYNGVAVYDENGVYLRNIGRFSSSYYPDNDDFYYVYGVAVDSDDNVYICDRYNYRVQVFNKDGGFVRSLSTNNSCKGIEVSPSDEIYIINGSSYVTIYNKSGWFITNWYKSGVVHLAFDSEGRHYVLRRIDGYERLHFYRADRSYVNFFYLTDDYVSYDMEYPTFIAVDDNNDIYISDSDYYDSAVFKIHRKSDRTHIDGSGDVDYVTYRGGYRSSSAGYYRTPYGVTWDPHREDVIIADFSNDRIQSFNAGEVVIAGGYETRLDQMVKVIKKIVSDSVLSDGAHFGLLEWSSSANISVPVSVEGAGDIYDRVDDLTASGNTYLGTAMSLAESYFLGEDSPRDGALTCQKNMIIVISDGYWVENGAEAVATNLANNYGTDTYVIGFQTTGNSNYVTLSQAGGTYPDSPLFAGNWQELYEKLSTVIRNAINADLTFAAPTIMPDVVGDDYILQATFRYKADHQWKGTLKKFALDENGEVSALAWDAGERMNLISAADRNIWTATETLPAGLNNFTAANMEHLRPLMEAHRSEPFDDADLTDLIQFVRGVDVYEEFADDEDDDGDALYAGDRWKLADIYHSRALAAGAPNARIAYEAHAGSDAYYRAENGYAAFRDGESCGGSCADRKNIVYAGSNGGMLHAFDSDTGDEVWAFIPPILLPKFKDMISSTAGKSNAVFGVDGSPVIKDVFDGEEWRTVLVIGLRQGGGGYSVLDVTDPLNPAHMFTIGYDVITEEIRYWNASGEEVVFRRTDSVPDGFNVMNMGETWSEPLILRLPVGINGEDKWVIAAGGGYNNRVNSDYGDRIYFFDIFGSEPVLHAIDLGDSDGGNNIRNSVPAKISAITADTTALFPYHGALLHVTDQDGILHKIDVSSNAEILYQRETVMNLESSAANGRVSFSPTVSAFADGGLYHVMGTGDITDLDNLGAGIDNRIFAARDAHFPDADPLAAGYTFDDLADKTDVGESCAFTEEEGWQVRLGNTGKSLSAATIFNNTVLTPVYYPSEDNVCAGGESSLLELNFTCGSEIRETGLGNGISTRAVVYNNRIYLGISDSGSAVSLPDGFVKTGNLIVGTPVNTRSTRVTVESWWE